MPCGGNAARDCPLQQRQGGAKAQSKWNRADASLNTRTVRFFYEVDMGKIKDDLNAAMAKAPAARSKLEVFFTYGGFRALFRHRRAHWFYKHGFKRLAQIISARTRKLTGVDIHPAAEIEGGVFIDHGVGGVIGETAVVGGGGVV